MWKREEPKRKFSNGEEHSNRNTNKIVNKRMIKPVCK